MSVASVQNAIVEAILTSIELLADVPATQNAVVENNQFNRGPTRLDSTTTPPVTRASNQEFTIGGGGTVDIDLTALAGIQDDIDGTGLKVQLIAIINNGANVMTIGPGAANKYHPYGTDKTKDVPAGGWDVEYFNDQLADVAAGVKMLRISGTAGQTGYLTIWLG